MRIRVWLVLVVVAIPIAIFVMRFIPLGVQQSLVSSLLAVSAIVFAIFGIWVSILDPTTIFAQTTDEELSPKQKLALELIPSLKQSTYILLGVIVLRLLLPLVIQLPEQYGRPAIWQMGVGFLVAFLFIAQALILVITMRWPDEIQRRAKLAKSRGQARKNATRKV